MRRSQTEELLEVECEEKGCGAGAARWLGTSWPGRLARRVDTEPVPDLRPPSLPARGREVEGSKERRASSSSSTLKASRLACPPRPLESAAEAFRHGLTCQI